MNESGNEVIDEGRMLNAESGTLALLNKSEIDMQISTAHKYPRSIKQFRTDVFNMVTLSEAIAAECIYALPRDGKMIEGPSARFAEVVVSAWGNARAGARVVSDAGEFVTAQGVFQDLQKNVILTYEVQRRIVDKNGRRFKADMIGVTANAACSIALRNAILKGVPKAFWSEMYEGARQTAMGDVKTLPTRRAEVFAALLRYGVTEAQACAKLSVKGKEDIGQEELVTLRFIITAIKDGDTTPEHAFAADTDAATAPPSGPKTKSAAPPPPSPSPASAPVAPPVQSPAPPLAAVAAAPTPANEPPPWLDDEPDALPEPPVEAAVAAVVQATMHAPAQAIIDVSRQSGELASEGEKKFVIDLARKKGKDLRMTLDAVGLHEVNDATLTGITQTEMGALIGRLNAR